MMLILFVSALVAKNKDQVPTKQELILIQLKEQVKQAWLML